MSIGDLIAAGMRQQLGRRDAELVAGARTVGWKLGLTDARVQQRLGLDGPVVGYITSATEVSPGSPHSLAGTSGPAAEPEVAIHLAEAVPAGASVEQARAAIAGLGVAIEVIDVDQPFDNLEHILAQNIFHRAVAFGPPAADDLDVARVVVSRDGDEAARDEVALDAPGTVRFVADFLAEHGAYLEPGQRIIAGSLVQALPVTAGESIAVAIDSLGELSVTFS